MEVETLATLRDGQITIADSRAWVAALLKLPAGEVIVSVRRAYATRTKLQNKFYWSAIVEPISEHTGLSPSETHEALKQRFLPVNVSFHGNGIEEDGTVIGGTTTSLSIREFSDFCDRIRIWAAEFLQLDLEPAPNDAQ